MKIENKVQTELRGGYNKIKKIISVLLVFMMMASIAFVVPVTAAVESKLGKVTNTPIYVDGEKAKQDILSISIDNRLYLPLRATSQLLGLNVRWIQAEQAVCILADPSACHFSWAGNRLG